MSHTKPLLVIIALLLLLSSTLAIATANYYQTKARREAVAQNVLAAVNANGGSYNLAWNVVAGGGNVMESKSYRLHSTVGQSAIGSLASLTYDANIGFWQQSIVATPTPTPTPTPTATATPSPTLTATPTATASPTTIPTQTATTTPVSQSELFLPLVTLNRSGGSSMPH